MSNRPAKRLSRLTLAAALLALPTAAQQPGVEPAAEPEQTPRYRVEFIVFEHTDANPDTERLPVASSLPGADAAASARRWPFGVEPEIGAFGEPVFTDRPQRGAPAAEPPGPGSADPASSAPDSRTGAAPADAPRADDTPGQAAGPGALPGAAPDAGAGGGPKIELFGPPGFQQRRLERWFEPLPADALELTQTRRQLERLGAYRVLAHAGWEQDALSEQQARPLSLAELGIVNPSGMLTMYVSLYVHVIADLRYRSDALGARALGADEPGPRAARGALDAGEPAPGPVGGERGVEPVPGTVGGERGVEPLPGAVGGERGPDAFDGGRAPAREPARTLGETRADSRFPPRGAARAPAVSPIRMAPTYVLSAQRRARTDELHYIDHPLFGILVRVTEAPEEPEEPEDTEAADGELTPAA